MSQVRDEGEKAAVREAGMRVYARKLAARDPVVQRFVRDSASYFNANPRQIKRYINLFRFYATLRYACKLDGIYDDPETVMPTDAALAKFVALSIHWPQAIGWLWAKNDGDQPSLTRLDQKARELAKGDGEKADASWAAYLKESQIEQEWALETEFRKFLATGESLSDYQGCRLWYGDGTSPSAGMGCVGV